MKLHDLLKSSGLSALAAALEGADEGDVVLAAGKGHEDYQQIGDERIPYSDRDLLRRLCAEAAS